MFVFLFLFHLRKTHLKVDLQLTVDSCSVSKYKCGSSGFTSRRELESMIA